MGNDYSNPHLEPRKIRKYGGFSDEELKDLKKNFHSLCNANHLLDRKKLFTLVRGTPPELDAICDFLDVDNNKEVDEYEFICGLSVIRQSSLMEKAKILFGLYSQSKQRKMMDPPSLTKVLKTVVNTTKSLTKQADVEDSEIKALVDQYFSLYDVDKTGEMSELEFVSLVCKEHRIHEFFERLGLLTTEDHRESTANEEDVDKDLQDELNLMHVDADERTERIKSGIEHTVSAEDELYSEDKEGGGDQFMAVKPWLGAVKNSVPSDYKPSKNESDAPKAQLRLEYVHGYRCHDSRNNLKYAATGEIVYHTAGVGIVYDPKNRTQRFFMEHSDDIICLDLFENMVITGQIGHKPLICVWDIKDLSCKLMLKGVLEKGIVNVCFSHDGKRFAASALDEEHNIVVYDIAKELATKENPSKTGLVAKGKGAKAEILDMRFLPDNKTLFLACNKECYLMEIDESKGLLKGKKGLFGKAAPEPVMSIGFLGTNVITGMSKGSLLVWNGNSAGKIIEKAHDGAINAMYSVKPFEKLLTGGNDGVVCSWNSKFEKVEVFKLKDNALVNSMMPKVRALYEKDGKIIIGTRGSEVIELVSKNPTVHIRGHFDGELWGLATHPSQGVYYTVGEDMMLASWDIASRSQISNMKLALAAKTIHVHPDGKSLAVGCLDGTTYIVNCSDNKKLAIVNTLKEKHEVSIVKYSPNGEILAAGIAPPTDEVLLYNVKKNFATAARLKGSPSRIIHIDFSEDSRVIQFNNTSYEILYFDSNDGKQLTHGASQNKDEKWASWTLIIGWPVQGIWPPCSDGSDINTVDRTKKRDVLATGDDFGKVKLFKYPCAKEKANSNKFGGHSAHVTAVRFSAKNDYLMSTGGGEKSIFQWQYETEDKEPAGEVIEEDSSPKSPKKAAGAQDDEFGEEEEKEADQMGATKPYLGQLNHSIPSWFKPSKKDQMGPDGSLSLSYVHGYRCFDDCRNTAKWLSDGRIVFVGAAIGVLFDYKKNRQEFFAKHEEDIVSMAVHPKGKIVATGQMAAKGKAKTIDLYVWDSETKKDFCNLNHFHLRAVNNVCFSADGSKLFSTGQDDDNSLAVHDWSSKTLLCTSNVDKAKVTGIACSPTSPNEFVTVGAKVIKFWTLNGRNASAKIGKMDANDKLIPFTCVAYTSKGVVVTGSASGDMALWNGGSAGKKTPAHKGEVGSIFTQGDLLYSGGGDGKVIIWEVKGSLTQKSVVIEASTLTKYNPGIRSIDINANGDFLIGTRGSEIFVQEKGKNNWKCVLHGHYDGEVWGCAASSKDYRFVSCGGDKTIRMWDAGKNVMVCGTLPLENDLKALDWDPKGDFVVAADVKGKIMLYSTDKLDLLHSLQSIFKVNPKKCDPWIEDIKISPNSDTIAFGAHGGNPEIQVMAVKDNKLNSFKVIKAALTSALTHLDYSEDGTMLVVNTQDYWLKYYTIDPPKDASASSCKDVRWFTWTCTLGFYSQGIFPGVDGTDVNSVCRSHNQKFLVTGDDFGKVNLFGFPCVVAKAKCIPFAGHSSHVTKVKFSYDDSYVFSTGGGDKCVITWKTSFGGAAGGKEEIKNQEEEEGANDEVNPDAEDVVKVKTKKQGKDKFKKGGADEPKHEEALFSEDLDEKGDEFMAVKPWLGAIKEPSGFKNAKDQNKPPDVTIELNYVFGYRAKDSRNNVRFLKSGSIVYHAAALGIVLDPENNTQRFFDKHIDDITSFDVHPDDETVATGEIGAKPSIYVWNSTTLAVKCQFKAVITKGICALAFSPGGKRLVAAAVDDDHWVAVMDCTGAGSVVAKVKGGRDVIISLAFNNEDEFTSVGNKHYKYWKIAANNMSGQKGDAANLDKLTLNCCEFMDGTCYVGSSDGGVFSCKGSSMGKPAAIHAKGVDAITVTKDNVFTGGKDNSIKVLTRSLKILVTIDCTKILKGPDSFCPQIRALAVSNDNKRLLIGTYASEIYQSTFSGPISEKTTFSDATCFMTGHYTPNKQWTNEVWGLAPFHKGDQYVTSSDDGTLRLYSALERKELKRKTTTLDSKLQETPPDKQTGDLQDSVKGRCIDVSQDDTLIAVGFKDGFVKIYDAETLEQKLSFKHAKEWISDLKFSPDNNLLAVGSHDNAIYLYSVPQFKKLFVMNKHSSYITHLDWSENSNNLHSNCGAYELLFWDASTGKQLPGGASALKDEPWATWTCVLGFPVQGIWPVCADGTDINYVDRSKNKHPGGYHLLASGDDFGKVRILRYPSVLKNSEAVSGVGHSSHVPCVKWSENDEFLYSVGGEDNCVFQWQVKKK